MATPICNADSWRKPLTAVQIAELQPEWDKVDKSNELLRPDAPPTQALPDRTQYYVSIRTPTGGITSSAVRYRSITAQRQANRQHAQHKRAIKNRDKLCPKRQLKLDIYVERVPMKYKAATYSKDSKCAHQPSTIKHKDKLCSKKQLKLDIYVERVPTEYKAKTDSEGSKCAHQQCGTTNQVKLCPNRQLKLDKYVKKSTLNTRQRQTQTTVNVIVRSAHTSSEAFHCTHHRKNTLLIVNLHIVNIPHSPSVASFPGPTQLSVAVSNGRSLGTRLHYLHAITK